MAAIREILGMDPAPKLWTLEDWDRMIDSGLLAGQRVMLLEGEILEMAANCSPHATGVLLTQAALNGCLPLGTHLRNQSPLYLGKASDPEPDLAVVPGKIRDYSKKHPTRALLVVEVSDSSLTFDLGRKASAYARYGIPEYWVVDLNGRCVHRHTRPNDLGYASIERLETEVAWNGHSIRVADLLP